MNDFWAVVVTVAVFLLLALVARGAEKAVSIANSVGLVLAVLFAIFLVIALLFPEKF